MWQSDTKRRKVASRSDRQRDASSYLFVRFKSSHSAGSVLLKCAMLRGTTVYIAGRYNTPHCPGPLSFRGISLDTTGKRTNVPEERPDACTDSSFFYGSHGRHKRRPSIILWLSYASRRSSSSVSATIDNSAGIFRVSLTRIYEWR